MAENKMDYPAKLTIDYPNRKLNRLTSFFRIFMVIPIAIVLGLLSSNGLSWGQHSHGWTTGAACSVGILFFSTLLMIFFDKSTRSGGSTGIWQLPDLEPESGYILRS